MAREYTEVNFIVNNEMDESSIEVNMFTVMGSKRLAEFIGTFWLVLVAVAAQCSQLWMFWLAPIVGGVLGALLYRMMGAQAAEE